MITHFAELRLQTVSLQGVRQVYGDRLGFPLAAESPSSLSFRLTPHALITFEESDEPIAPAHFALEVAYSTFHQAVDFLKQAGLLILRWDDGHEVDEDGAQINLYFRDGDGHILEIIAHRSIDETAIPTDHPLRPLYLREVGFPVESVPAFRHWLKGSLGMRTRQESDTFNFVVSGTAHAVVVAKSRPWLPIAMKALPPRMQVVFGTPDPAYIDALRSRLAGEAEADSPQEIRFMRDGYPLALRLQPEFPVDLLHRLKLPALSLPAPIE